uniref:Kaptin n=1 Tax=Biomphalaria glabrata TaxID=6526 RepID=A0A2C9KLB6_BIOGL
MNTAVATKQFYWIDAHFSGLRSQTNIYGLAKMASEDGITKLLAVSIDGHFVTVEYQKSFDNRLIPVTKEDVFFDISSFPETGEIEIVSVDVICSNVINNRVILAYSYLKIETSYEEKSPNAYMNIYFLPARESTREMYSNFMDAINQSSRQHLSLDFIPFKLTHHLIYEKDGETKMCLIIGGNDHKIHVFMQSTETLCFCEEKEAAEKYFPEFQKIDGCVTQIEFCMVDATHRLSVLGNQNGLVTLTIVNMLTKEIKNIWHFEMDSLITSLLLFNQHTKERCPDFLDTQEEDEKPVEKEIEPEPLNLLITSAIDLAIVFCDVVNLGLTNSYLLPLSNTQDAVLCSCVADIDFDGENEILIGTYGQVVLAYKFMQEKPVTLMTSTPYHSPFPVPVSDKFHSSEGDENINYDQEKFDSRRRHKSMAAVFDNIDGSRFDDWNRAEDTSNLDRSLKDAQIARLVRSQENLATSKSVNLNTPEQLSLTNTTACDLNEYYPGYRLIWTKCFSDPVMSLAVADVMRDGMLDLVVLTLKGLHILQPDLNDVATLVMDRLKLLCESESEADDDFHQLQMELLQDQQLQ